MSKFQRRIFICIDEWLGAFYCAWLWHEHRESFWIVFVFWAFCTYVIAYPAYWGWWSWFWSWWRT